MRNEPAEIHLKRLKRPVVYQPAQPEPFAIRRDAQITDAAFADLSATMLRIDEPVCAASALEPNLLREGLAEQLADQLQALDQQRSRLAQLLSNLQGADSSLI